MSPKDLQSTSDEDEQGFALEKYVVDRRFGALSWLVRVFVSSIESPSRCGF